MKGVPVDVFEECRNGARRSQGELKMPACVRANVLMNRWDYSLSSISRASLKVDAVRKARQKTARKGMKHLLRQERVQSACKPLKNAFKKLKRNSRPSLKVVDIRTPLNLGWRSHKIKIFRSPIVHRTLLLKRMKIFSLGVRRQKVIAFSSIELNNLKPSKLHVCLF